MRQYVDRQRTVICPLMLELLLCVGDRSMMHET